MNILSSINLAGSGKQVNQSILSDLERTKDVAIPCAMICSAICSAIWCEEATCDKICDIICSTICGVICDAIDTFVEVDDKNNICETYSKKPKT